MSSSGLEATEQELEGYSGGDGGDGDEDSAED